MFADAIARVYHRISAPRLRNRARIGMTHHNNITVVAHHPSSCNVSPLTTKKIPARPPSPRFLGRVSPFRTKAAFASKVRKTVKQALSVQNSPISSYGHRVPAFGRLQTSRIAAIERSYREDVLAFKIHPLNHTIFAFKKFYGKINRLNKNKNGENWYGLGDSGRPMYKVQERPRKRDIYGDTTIRSLLKSLASGAGTSRAIRKLKIRALVKTM